MLAYTEFIIHQAFITHASVYVHRPCSVLELKKQTNQRKTVTSDQELVPTLTEFYIRI